MSYFEQLPDSDKNFINDMDEPYMLVREECLTCPGLETKLGEAALAFVRKGAINVVICNEEMGDRKLFSPSCKASVLLLKVGSESRSTDPILVSGIGGKSGLSSVRDLTAKAITEDLVSTPVSLTRGKFDSLPNDGVSIG